MTDRAREVLALELARILIDGDTLPCSEEYDEADAILAALDAEGLAVQSADEVEARIAEAVAARDAETDLAAALDTVIAEVEALSVDDLIALWLNSTDDGSLYRDDLISFLRALRAEHSAGEGEDTQ